MVSSSFIPITAMDGSYLNGDGMIRSQSKLPSAYSFERTLLDQPSAHPHFRHISAITTHKINLDTKTFLQIIFSIAIHKGRQSMRRILCHPIVVFS